MLAWSLGAAAAAHVAFFTLTPDIEVVALDGSRIEAVQSDAGRVPTTALEVRFGPPAIAHGSGEIWQEPEHRTLEARRATDLPMLCTHLVGTHPLPMRGSVRLRVDETGHALAIEVAESTGDACVDHVLVEAADALRYHWLPNDRFAAPVYLVQPVTLLEIDG